MSYCCWQVGEMEQASLVSKGLEVGITAACVGALCGKHGQLGMARAWCMGDSCRRWHLSVMLKDSGFYPESNGELLEGFKHGNNK